MTNVTFFESRLVSRVRGRHHISLAAVESSLVFFVFGLAFFVFVTFGSVSSKDLELAFRFWVFLGGSGSGELATAKAGETPLSLRLRRSVVEAAVLIADTAVFMGGTFSIDF